MRQYVILSACLLLVVAGCSEPQSPAPVQADNYLAIARGKVVVEGGLVEITIPADERFDAVMGKIGAKVAKGAVLGTLDSRQASLAVAEAKAEYRQTAAQIAALEQRVTAAAQLAQRTRGAAQAGAVEQQQADEAEQAVSLLKSEIATAKTSLELVAIRQQQAELALEQRVVKAPMEGELIKVSAQQGARLGESAAFVLLPARPLQVRAEVNEGFVSRLQVGVKAAVSLESAPEAPALAAHVVRVGRLVETGNAGEAQTTGRVVEVMLDFEQSQSVLVGQNVMVKFHE